MKPTFRTIPWLILIIPFAVLAYFYNSIPNEVLIARSFFGGETTFAPKSLFTVFRVPLIETVCAAAIEVMRRKFAETNAEYYLMWSILLYTVAFKSLFQAFEIISSKDFVNLFYYLTFGVVIVGIVLALWKGRKVFLNFFQGSWALSHLEKAILVILLIAYLSLAIVPIFVFG
jgi:hypothetical protein